MWKNRCQLQQGVLEKMWTMQLFTVRGKTWTY